MIKAVQPVRLDDYRSRQTRQKSRQDSVLARARRLTDLSAVHAESLLADLAGCVDEILASRETLILQATANGGPQHPVQRLTLLKGGKG